MHKKCVFWLNLLSALCGFTGVALSLAVNGPKCLALYSDLTALFAGIISIVYAARLDRAGRKDRVFRFASAVSQVLVLLFALISLLPAFSFSFSKFSPHLILMHFCAPTLSLISYFALERDGQLRFSDTLYGYLFTGMYAVFAIVLCAAGIAHTEAYPFLNFYPGHMAVPFLEDAGILCAIYGIDWTVYRLSRR